MLFNTFLVNGKSYKIKQMTVDEQKELSNLDILEIAQDKEKFLELTNKYILNKKFTFDFASLEEEREEIIKAIIIESDINIRGDFDILKTFDKINDEAENFVFIIFKFLSNFGYKYQDIKTKTQQEIVELCIYEAILNSDIKNLITFLKESNNIFKNKNIESIINELEKQTFNKTEIQPNKNVKSGMEGLMDLK